MRNTIREALSCMKTGTSDLNNILAEVFESLPKDLRSEIGSNDDVRDYIIYEVIAGDV